MPVPAAWSSWRPGAFPGPSPQQWKQWMPRKGSGKGKGKLGELSWGQQAPWGPPLGQLQEAPHNYDQNGDAMLWMQPLCALTATDPEQWSTVGKNGMKMKHVNIGPERNFIDDT